MVVLNENEFEELMDEIKHRFSKANIDGTLKALLEKLGWNALLVSDAEPLFTFENGKILVIGEQTVGIDMITLCEQSNKNLLLGIGQSGSTREAINKQEMEDFKIPLPDSDVINLFGTKTDACFRQIHNAILQTENLLSIRSSILSQL